MATSEPTPVRAAAVRFILITILLDVIGFGIVIPIAPRLVDELVPGGMSEAAFYIGVVMALYTVTQFLCAPLLGALSDRYGRKPILLISLVASMLSYVGAALAPTLWLLIAARAMGGLGGASISVATTYMADVSPPAKRAQNFGLMGAAFGLGFIFGPMIGGLAGASDPRLPFWFAAAAAGLNALYGFFVLPESLPAEGRNTFSWRSANPIAWVALLRKYTFVWSLALGLFWSGLAQNTLHTSWVVYTTYKFDWTTQQTGLSLALVGLTSAIVQGWLIRLILPKLGERRAILVGLVVMAVSMTLYAFATHSWMMYAILVGASIGGIAGPSMQAQISKEVPGYEQGAVQGALASIMSLTGIIAPLAANGTFGYFTRPSSPIYFPGVAFLFGAACALVSLVTTVYAFRRHPEPAPVITLQEA